MGALLFRCRQIPILQFPVRTSVVVLGRSVDCEFVVGHESVSRRHAEIRRADDDELEVRDLRSLNGTFVSDRRIESGRVGPGQIVRFGVIEFEFGLQPYEERATDLPPHPQGEGASAPPCEAALSKAQRRVFALLKKGLSEKAIAKVLVLSRHTIHNHTRAIFRALDVHSRVQLLALVPQAK